MTAPPRSDRPATATPPTWRRHPAVLTVRRAVRRVLAHLKATVVHNPPLPEGVRSLLYVCKGNICRSPFAAFHGARLASEAGLALTHQSAGLKPSQAAACPPGAVEAATRYGHDLSTWRPVPLTDELMVAHDLVVVMEVGQLEAVRTRWPAHRGKTVLLSLFGPQPADPWARLVIEDPFGKDTAAFDACYVRLDAALRDLLARLPR